MYIVQQTRELLPKTGGGETAALILNHGSRGHMQEATFTLAGQSPRARAPNWDRLWDRPTGL